MTQWVRSLTLVQAYHQYGVGSRPDLKKKQNKAKKRCTRLTVASDEVYHLLVPDRWLSPGTLASYNWLSQYYWNIVESGVKTQEIKSINQIATDEPMTIKYYPVSEFNTHHDITKILMKVALNTKNQSIRI